MSAAALSPIRLRYRPSVEHVAIAFGLREASDSSRTTFRDAGAKARDRRAMNTNEAVISTLDADPFKIPRRSNDDSR